MSEFVWAKGVEVEVYGRPGCGDCDEAKKVFDKAQVPYEAKNIRADAEALAQVTKVCESFGRKPSVPVIIIHHKIPGEVDGQIVFIEPRGLGLQVLANTLLTLRVPAPR